MLTSHPHVYAAGDITGFSLLAHTAYREAEVAIHHILGIPDEMSYKAIPAVVYTNPELASVGKTEEELVANGESFRVQKIPMTYSGRFVAENENSNGLCKLITDDGSYHRLPSTRESGIRDYRHRRNRCREWLYNR